ncbi:hypothetical protein WH285_13870 [Acinetobacter johnsonii]|uniref:hypothetical protein n=1 Tax=Acinetobacter johnsonii TaxID=40214 RepID=UPI00309D3CD5
MNVLFFPANKLGAFIAPIYNGYDAIVSHNTDRLIDGKYALAELNAFKSNVQCTSFLHAFGDTTAGENVNYGDTIKAVHNTGRISFGLYWRSDLWVNPSTGIQETIPDYYATAWTAAGAAVFANAVVGVAKGSRSPNHGQQLYDLSNGAYGYDMVNGVMGASNLSETYLHTEMQLDHIKTISGLYLTSGSYTNGAQGGWNVLIPKFFGMRNSVHTASGNNGNIKYSGMNRQEMMQEASTTRTWDAVNAGQFVDQAASLAYTSSEIERAIASGGWFSDFMHWHSLYTAEDTAFFEPFMQNINESIGSSDVWRAGNNEVNEYYVLANSIDKIGSYVHYNKAFIFIRFKDFFIGTDTNGISNAIDPTKITTPISIEINLTGTSLAGKSIASDQAVTVRSLGSNKWIVNVNPVHSFKNGYMTFVLSEAQNTDQLYVEARPILNRSGNTVTANQKCKFVVWRKALAAADTTLEAVHRTTSFSASLNYVFDTANYAYYVGGITRSRVSSLISI